MPLTILTLFLGSYFYMTIYQGLSFPVWVHILFFLGFFGAYLFSKPKWFKRALRKYRHRNARKVKVKKSARKQVYAPTAENPDQTPLQLNELKALIAEKEKSLKN